MPNRRAIAAAVLAVVVLAAAASAAGIGPWRASVTPGPTPTLAPGITPAGGVARDSAIEIAANAVKPNVGESTNTTAVATYHSSWPLRWCWVVTFTEYGGPTSSSGKEVVLDFYTGEVLSTKEWVS